MCALKRPKVMPQAVRLMVVDPPEGLTDRPYKPPCGTLFRKNEVLSDKEKAREYSSGEFQ